MSGQGLVVDSKEEDDCADCGEPFKPEYDFDCVGDPPRFVPAYEQSCAKCVKERKENANFYHR